MMDLVQETELAKGTKLKYVRVQKIVQSTTVCIQ